jgi:hypothetical protein
MIGPARKRRRIRGAARAALALLAAGGLLGPAFAREPPGEDSTAVMARIEAPWENPARCAFVDHEIEATLDPSSAGLQAIAWPLLVHPPDVPATRKAPFLLNRSLTVSSIEAFEKGRLFPVRWELRERWEPCDFWERPEYPELGGLGHARQIDVYPAPPATAWPESLLLVVTYGGVVYDSLRAPTADYQRGFETTTGLIDPRGVFLSGASLWYPRRFDPPCPHRLRAAAPPGWLTVSQGRRVWEGEPAPGDSTDAAATPSDSSTGPILWDCAEPMDEIYLVAGPYVLREESHRGIAIQTFTYGNDDAELCRRYLDATRGYLDLYQGLIGPYPFPKFALVENFWQTGYGMPGFTLLGSTVIRLPWILTTSYGHEILHNWWGNSVYVAAETGNWCEGLTAYGADYLYKERESASEARDHRRAALQGYLDYVRAGRDFPLTEFRARESAATEAIGYRKSMMIFHMLRRQVGDEAFWRGLGEFYRRFKFRPASWADLLGTFGALTGESLDAFREQWVARAGAPELSLAGVDLVPRRDGGADLSYRLEQTAPAYTLEVPVRVTFADREPEAWMVRMDGASFSEARRFAGRPRGLEIDPDFDLFRKLHRGEAPAAISQLMGADSLTAILAPGAPPELREAYRAVARDLGRATPLGIPADGALVLDDLRAGGAWIFGEPSWAARLREQVPPAVEIDERSFRVAGRSFDRATHTLVLALPHPNARQEALGWMLASDAAAAEAVGGKLARYGKYSYLVFAGAENVAKGTWEITRSPLKVTWEEEK